MTIYRLKEIGSQEVHLKVTDELRLQDKLFGTASLTYAGMKPGVNHYSFIYDQSNFFSQLMHANVWFPTDQEIIKVGDYRLRVRNPTPTGINVGCIDKKVE